MAAQFCHNREWFLEQSLASLSLPICKIERLPLPHYIAGHGGIQVMVRTWLSVFYVPPSSRAFKMPSKTAGSRRLQRPFWAPSACLIVTSLTSGHWGVRAVQRAMDSGDKI